MPFALPRDRMDQAAYNRQLQRQFASTRRVPLPPPPAGAISAADQRKELHALLEAGALTQSEFDVISARLPT